MARAKPVILNLFVVYSMDNCRQHDLEKGTVENVSLIAVKEFRTIHAKETQRAAYNRLMARAIQWMNDDKANNGNHSGHKIADWHDDAVTV